MPRAQKIFVSLFFSVLLFAASGAWLFFSWQAGNKSSSWMPTEARVTANDADFGTGRHSRKIARGWRTSIEYSVEGKQYEAVIDDYLVGNNVTVYVNPQDHAEVVGKQGPGLNDVFNPVVATVATGLFTLVVILIAFSPKEDQYTSSEDHQTIF